MVQVETKTLNMRHQVQKGIPDHQKLYTVYAPSTRKIISSYDVVFDESFSSALAYMSRHYSEAMAMRPAVTYTPYATSSKEQTGDVITFTRFQKGNILPENCRYPRVSKRISCIRTLYKKDNIFIRYCI